MDIDNYLEAIQKDESIFPMDSYKGDKKKVIRTMYPEQVNPDIPIRKRAMVDFDGVISRYENGWNDGELSDDLMPGAKKAIDEMQAMGYEICVFTTRASDVHNVKPSAKELVSALKVWLKEHDIYYDRITAEKLGATFYIDDKGIRFTGNWEVVMEQVRNIDSEIKDDGYGEK